MNSPLITLLLLPNLIYAQQKPLSVDDKLPTGILTSLTTNTKPQTISDKLKTGKKLIILDFFATWCTACIRELPRLDSLQKIFKGNLDIILVTRQPREKIEEFRKKNKLFASIPFPVITSDTVLTKLFPHKILPHDVWINEKGKVLAITESSELSGANIETALLGKELHLPLKKDESGFDYTKPILQNGNGEARIIYRSLFTGPLRGMASSQASFSEGGTIRHFFINRTILSLYQEALGFEPNRVILEVSDPSIYVLPSFPNVEWQNTNLFSYELTMPASAKERFRSLMATDLDRYLGLHGRIEKRKLKCWALIADTVAEPLLKTRSTKQIYTIEEATNNYILRNQPFRELVKACNAISPISPGQPIIVDETGITCNIDIDIPAEAFKDLAYLKRTLSKYHLQLIQVEREIEMFILTEPNYKP